MSDDELSDESFDIDGKKQYLDPQEMDELSDESFDIDGKKQYLDPQEMDYYGQVNLEKLKSFRDKIDWMLEEQRFEYVYELDALIKDWSGRLPNLRDVFQTDEIERLLADSINCYDGGLNYNYIDKRFIWFVTRTGYRDEPDLDDDGRPLLRRTTPIHHAARRERYDIVRQLFEIYDRFDVNYTDEFGYTHFHAACETRRRDLVEGFLKAGQDPNLLVEKTGDSPLGLAYKNEDQQVFQLLLRYGANPNLGNAPGLTLLHVLSKRSCATEAAEVLFEFSEEIDQPIQIDARDYLGNTPLHLAMHRREYDLAELLLEKGADPNLTDADGSTALHICVSNFNDNFAKSIFEVSHEKYRLVQFDARDKLGRTPLELAVKNCMPKTVDLLLDHGADLSDFVFPTESIFAESLEITNSKPVEFKLKVACDALRVVERLEKGGYELVRSDALTIMKTFGVYKLIDESEHLDSLHKNEYFLSKAKGIMLNPSLSLYELIGLRPDTAKNLLTPEDYFKVMNKLWNLPEEFYRVCAWHLYEKIWTGFFHRWTPKSLMEVTRYQLPILCCEKIIENLMNEDLLRICQAADIIANEQSQNLSHCSLHQSLLSFISERRRRFRPRAAFIYRRSNLSNIMYYIAPIEMSKNRYNDAATVHEGRRDFACDKCEKKFGQKAHLLSHQRTVHEDQKDFTCDKCGKKFTQKPSLLCHQKIVHEGRKDYACDNCDKKFGQKPNLLRHQREVHEDRKDYACNECGKKFGYKKTLLRHQKEVHEGRKDYICDRCQLTFGYKHHLLSHQKQVHEGQKDYACDNCERKFGRKLDLLRHQGTVHKGRKDFACDKCEKKFGHKSAMLSHIRTIHEGRKDYPCDKCEKKFGQKSHFFYHQKIIHEGRKDYACNQCEKKFGLQYNLIKHQKLFHENRKDYACYYCEKKFGLKYILLAHIKIVHEGRKDFACDKCEKKFGAKAKLIIHQKIVHEGRKDFACDKCEKKFGAKAKLIIHQKIVHEGRKDYACAECGKKFGYKKTLLIHQKTVHEGRKDYVCDKCQLTFGYKHHLLSHQKQVHEGQKDYACDNCERKFGRKFDLLRHQATVHKCRKDFACDKCEKKFGAKAKLIIHQKIVHEGRKDFACDKKLQTLRMESSDIILNCAVRLFISTYVSNNYLLYMRGARGLFVKHDTRLFASTIIIVNARNGSGEHWQQLSVIISDEYVMGPRLAELGARALGPRFPRAQPLAVAVGKAQHAPARDHGLGAAVALASPVQLAAQRLRLAVHADPGTYVYIHKARREYE
ncbi:unnamed protein product [Trichogramma brassicae]|uniref:C2H2-type domain-containing protein n=1 Tax=Trichogramma brassicae TaxID=86971 RepID=A0A6H5IMQ5_9HYME|nr:unnamed protein product [Trichogramma brassicae]